MDIEDYSQLKKFILVINNLRKQKKFLFRTAASFIGSITGIKNNCHKPLFYSNLRRKNSEKKFFPGLIVVGSYIELTTKQLKRFLEISDCQPIELDAFEFSIISSLQNNQDKLILFKNKLLASIRYILNTLLTKKKLTEKKSIFQGLFMIQFQLHIRLDQLDR